VRRAVIPSAGGGTQAENVFEKGAARGTPAELAMIGTTASAWCMPLTGAARTRSTGAST